MRSYENSLAQQKVLGLRNLTRNLVCEVHVENTVRKANLGTLSLDENNSRRGDAMTEIEEINDLNFEQEVLASALPFLLDFTAAWCGPCKRLTPLLQALAADERGRLRVGKLDLDQSPITAQNLGVRAAPTLVVFRDGTEVGRRVGLLSKAKLRELISP